MAKLHKDIRDTVIWLIATELDRPGVYMDGASTLSKAKAERIIDILERSGLFK